MFYYVQPSSVFFNPRFNQDWGFAKPGSKKFYDSGYIVLYEHFCPKKNKEFDRILN